MCGIAGYFANTNKPSKAIRKALKSLAVSMEERGNQSWGCTDGQNIVRRVGPISRAFNQVGLPPALPRNFALHTRWATTGKVKEGNSHPFLIPDRVAPIIGMHNGIISNHATLNRQYRRSCRVDSMHIFQHIREHLPLTDLEGYGTIVYRQGDSWFIGTFNGGELAMAHTREGFVFASTFKALDKALTVAGLSDSARDVKLHDDTVYRLTDDQWLAEEYKIDAGYTFAKWDDNLTSQYGSLTCNYCNDVLTIHEEDLCTRCELKLTGDESTAYKSASASREDDWHIEVVPEGMFMTCDDCGSRVGEFEEVAIFGDDAICSECLMGYEESTVRQ